MPYDFYIKAGGSYPPFKQGIVNENNSAVDISGAKAAKFYLAYQKSASSMIINGKAATITDSVNGYIQYTFTAGDTSGYSNTEAIAEFQITMSDDSVMKVPDIGYKTIYIGDSLQ